MTNRSTLETLEAFLKRNLDSCQVWPDGTVLHTRQRVDVVAGRLKIEIYPKEHAPAHFHVKYNNIDASFEIENCKLIAGAISNKDYCILKDWHRGAKEPLIKAWNDTRPANCPVGAIK